MIAIGCSHTNYKKSGKNRNGSQRYKCKDCGVRFSDPPINTKPLGNMRVDLDKAMLILGMLLEGTSIRAASRLTGIDKDSIGRLILEAGDKCQNFLNRSIVNVPISDLQIDEIWSFVKMKAKQAKRYEDPAIGDYWTYVCVERKTKLVVAHYVGKRSSEDTHRFLAKVRRAIDTSIEFQVSTDGWKGYRYGVPINLGENVNFGQLVKSYSSSQEVTRYSPAQIISTKKQARFGSPDIDRICTSHVESLNQKIRMHLRRFTRLTRAHSKSLRHHVAMQAIFFAHYNFCREHSSLDRKTPAMENGLADRMFTIVELLS